MNQQELRKMLEEISLNIFILNTTTSATLEYTALRNVKEQVTKIRSCGIECELSRKDTFFSFSLKQKPDWSF
jgi:hypothetical protein